MNCAHTTQFRLESRSGIQKILCAECLDEMSKPVLTGEPIYESEYEPYTQEAVKMLTSGTLTEWEAEFIPSLGKMRTITDKQKAIWTKCVRKYFPKGLAGCDLSQGSEDLDLDTVPF